MCVREGLCQTEGGERERGWGKGVTERVCDRDRLCVMCERGFVCKTDRLCVREGLCHRERV